jgi:hypothetical protein
MRGRCLSESNPFVMAAAASPSARRADVTVSLGSSNTPAPQHDAGPTTTGTTSREMSAGDAIRAELNRAGAARRRRRCAVAGSNGHADLAEWCQRTMWVQAERGTRRASQITSDTDGSSGIAVTNPSPSRHRHQGSRTSRSRSRSPAERVTFRLAKMIRFDLGLYWPSD